MSYSSFFKINPNIIRDAYALKKMFPNLIELSNLDEFLHP